MKTFRTPKHETISCNESYVAESLEQKMRKVIAGADTIEDTADIIFTERKDGVLPQYDIRTDRFDIALEAMDKVSATQIAQREERLKAAEEAAKKKDEFKPIETDVTPQ